MAVASGNVALDWSYSGWHSYFQVTAELSAFVTHNGVTTSYSLVSAGPADCGACIAPSNGFNYTGQVTLPAVQAGDAYGFVMGGSQYTNGGELSGTLTVSPRNLVQNGGFESPIAANATTFDTFPAGDARLTGWVIASGSIDLIRGLWQPAEGAQSIDLDGSAAGTIYQDLQTEAGRSYVLHFRYSANPQRPAGNAQMTAGWGDANGAPSYTQPVIFTNGQSTLTNMGWLVSEQTVQATSTTTRLSFTSSDDPGSPYGIALDDVRVTVVPLPPPPALAAPTLIRVVEDTGGGSTFVIGRVDNALPSGTSVQAFTVTPLSCVGGVPATVSAIGSPVPVTITTDLYFGAAVPGVSSGQFLAIKLTDGSGTPISDISACLPSVGGNDFWTTALLLGTDDTTAGISLPVGDYIDAPGKTRWYKFKVAPGQRISVTLSGLPADYDLALFKDIGAAFAAQLAPADSTALTKLSAEFAPSAFSPSAFSPSAFSPSAFSPSAFSPSAFSPSAFSPSAFSPSAFSPSAFSPSAFSPSAFSPSAFSPSAFSPSAFSPSAFSPSAFSPSAFSPDIINTAFSSAQTRSIIAVSATPGTGDESAVVDSWNNSGYFYARVTGRGAAFSSTSQFHIAVAKGATSCAGVNPLGPVSRTASGSNYKTVILTDSSVLADGTLAGKLATFAGRSEIAGVVVDVARDTLVPTLKAQAAANPFCPYATNLVAEEIKSIVDSYRNLNLKYVVIAGGDDVIPFFRYPDEALLGPESGYVPPVTGVSDASLRGNYVLSQDAYGSNTRISLRTSDFPIPGLAVGRLVKTPAEIVGMIDAYTAATAGDGTTVQPRSSLVTGYDFLADVAGAVATELVAGIGTTIAPMETLITPNSVAPQDPTAFPTGPWTATNLAATLFGSRHDVVFLAGHFSANSALAADFATNLITSDLAASATDFTNSIVFSAGCHSGYSIVNRDAITGATFTLDWAEAFAQKKATLIAGTGYQYGDTDFIEYSERLYLNFAKELRAGYGPVAVGQALVKAKLDYLAATPDIRGIHTKALLESTLYGLPMLGVNMPAGRGGVGGSVLTGIIAAAPVVAPAPAARLGLRIADIHLNSSDLATTQHTQQLKGATKNIAGPLASWLSGNLDGVVSNPAEPALPLKVVNVTPTDGTIVLRGVGFRGGSYGDSTVVPLTGAPATEIRGVHGSFASPYFFPMRPWTVNYFGALAGNGATSLLVTPAQHRALDLDPAGTGALRSTLRSFSNLDLRLYYSGNYDPLTQQVSLSDAPTIVSVGAQQSAPPGPVTVTFSAQVTGDPAAAIHHVWVLYTDGNGAWVPVDLEQCIGTSLSLPPACGTTTDSQNWKGTASVPAGSLQFVVQAANGLGLVAFDDNRGAYYTFAGAVTPQEAQSTMLVFDSAPTTSATYGDTVSVTARLTSTSNNQPVAGAVVNVKIGDVPNSGLTDANGRVTLSATVASAPGSYTIVASYLGGNTLQASPSVTSSFLVNAAPAQLALLPSPAIGVILTEPVVTGSVTTQVPVAGQSVSFLLTAAGVSQTVVVNTDTAGNATLPTSGLPAGMYSIAATFLPASVAGGVTNYAGATLALPTFVMNAQSVTLTTPALVTYAAPGTFLVSAAVSPKPNSSQPIKITSTTPTVCTVAGTPAANQADYTATIVAAGADCVLKAEVAGTNFYTPALVTKTIPIAKAAQTITFAAPATLMYGQSTPPFPIQTDAPAQQSITYAVAAPCSIDASNKVTATTGTGTCTIGATAPVTPLYSAYSNATFASISLKTAPQQIVFATVSPQPTFVAGGGGTFQVGATGGASGNPVTFTVPATTSVCSVAGTTVTMLSAGTCTIAANQAGSTNYGPAPTATQSVTISKASQTITFANPGNKTIGTPPFALVATASSGLPVTFGVAGSCTVAGTTLTLTSTGSCTVTAKQPGNTNFAQAADVPQSFLIDLANVWKPTASKMTVPRSHHTATRLETGPLAGKILIVGGLDATGSPTATSELYDPSTRKFIATTGKMDGRSADHTATLLQDGQRVVVIGGGNTSVDVFNQATQTWSAAGTLPANRTNHTATLLPSGKILIVGGADNTGATLKTALVYDPVTKLFATLPTLDTARERHTATLVVGGPKDGTVLIVGGRYKSSTGYVTLATYQFCNESGCTTSQTGIALRQKHAAVGLAMASGANKVLVAGGTDGTSNLATAELYDVLSGMWSNTGLGSLTPGRKALTLSGLPNGRALAAGGRGKATPTATGAPLASADVYTPPFTSAAPMNVARSWAAATPLKDASGNVVGILVTGGKSGVPAPSDDDDNSVPSVDSAEVYGSP